VVREAFVDSDGEQRRLVWSVTENRLGLTHVEVLKHTLESRPG